MKTDYTPHTYEAASFNCPHCGAFSQQRWDHLRMDTQMFPIRAAGHIWSVETGDISYSSIRSPIAVSACEVCDRIVVWVSSLKVYPRTLDAPLPSSDMPDQPREFYEEARLIFGDSPRAAAALLRLALEKLMESQEVPGDTLNQQIGNLVKERKLPLSVPKSLDAVRVIGNDAIHDLGQIQLYDDSETAGMLFGLVNFAVEKLIADPETVNGIYKMLPESKRKAIEKRDNPQ